MRPPRTDFLDELSSGYQASQILFTAQRLGVFDALAAGGQDDLHLSKTLDCSPRGMRILCDALVDLGVLERSPAGYRLGSEAQRYLGPDAPEARSHLLQHGARLYERWAGLIDAVRTGEPVDEERLDPRLSGSQEDFARAMADVGRRSAAATCRQLDLSDTDHLLDLGGGPAVYACEFARQWPSLRVTVMDTPETHKVARQTIADSDLTERVHLLAADFLEDPLGGPYDAVFVSNVLHIYSAIENRRLIQRCAGVLESGGRLILKDFFLDEDRQRPAGGAVFAVNMLVSTEGGDCYTVPEAVSWLEHANLRLDDMRDIASRSRLLIAVKPS